MTSEAKVGNPNATTCSLCGTPKTIFGTAKRAVRLCARCDAGPIGVIHANRKAR